ncbi:melanopsin-like [Clytia hemisphaerica]|uniref:G-protein coupled receptors family 1 profile domain-containing protein n=1 Tax=Clytia hemisphaerica TaxID=252671 RepID=A0A7M5XFH3_9CNID
MEWIVLSYSKHISSAILAFSLSCILLNLFAIYRIYNKRWLRSTSTAIIVCNVACVDILVTLKDVTKFMDVIQTGHWKFVDKWCQANGLNSVIFIIVSVSTLATIASDRFARLRRNASSTGYPAQNSLNPLVLGFVIAHTTLSYSLSLLWSKYIFITRKAACRVDWPPHGGFSLAFIASFIFVIPVSALVYNVLLKSLEINGDKSVTDNEGAMEKTKQEIYDTFEKRAQQQIQYAVTIFLTSWTPYVAESLFSSYFLIHPNFGLLVATIPVVSTSLMPIFFVAYVIPNKNLYDNQPSIVVQ